MEKINSAIRLLALLSIFFIYKAIMALVDDNSNELILWSLIAIIYIISIVIMYFVFRQWEKEKT